MARDVVGMMQRLELERAHIVGSSLGAEVGISVAANYPDKALSLACEGALSSEYGPYSTWEGSEAEFEEHVARQLESVRNAPEAVYPSVDAFVEARRNALEKHGLWNEYFEAVERYDAHQVGEGKYTRAFGKRALEDYLKHYFHCRFEDYYRRVRCPLVMLPGEEDLKNERGKAAMEGLRALAAQGEIIEVGGWTHPYGWLLNPEAMSKAILKFLNDTAH